MYDALPFPMINGKTPEEQVLEIVNYLAQFKETLEFILMNISIDNLSQELVDRLNSLGMKLEKSIEDRDDQIGQVSNRALALTVSDVIASEAFQSALMGHTFMVNFETGNLEYTI